MDHPDAPGRHDGSVYKSLEMQVVVPACVSALVARKTVQGLFVGAPVGGGGSGTFSLSAFQGT